MRQRISMRKLKEVIQLSYGEIRNPEAGSSGYIAAKLEAPGTLLRRWKLRVHYREGGSSGYIVSTFESDTGF